jgi:hypothetical protein
MTKVVLDEQSGELYFFCNSGSHPLSRNDYSVMKTNNWLQFWSAEWLEDMDMFYESPGYRVRKEGVQYLKAHGYEVVIHTIAEKKKAEAEAEKKKAEAHSIKKTEEANARQKVVTMRATFANMKFHGPGEIKEFEELDYLADQYGSKIIQVVPAPIDEYYQFGLTGDGRIFVHNHYNWDWWDSECSDEKAPQAYLDAIKQEVIA